MVSNVQCGGTKDWAKLGRSYDEMLTFSLSCLSLEEGRAAVGEETTGQRSHDGSMDSWPVNAMVPEKSGELEASLEAHTGGLILLFLIPRVC
jgi:hypothetical protein